MYSAGWALRLGGAIAAFFDCFSPGKGEGSPSFLGGGTQVGLKQQTTKPKKKKTTKAKSIHEPQKMNRGWCTTGGGSLFVGHVALLCVTPPPVRRGLLMVSTSGAW